MMVAAVSVPAGNEIVRVTLSAGVASCRTSGVTQADALLAAADEALYRAKSLGRNRVEAAGPAAQPLQI
jgi:diguanylate cyclase (GGDEF)-like protein